MVLIIFNPRYKFVSGYMREKLMEILSFTVENLKNGCVTDKLKPRFSFSIKSDKNDAYLKKATITVGGNSWDTSEQVLVPYKGAPLKRFTQYTAYITAYDNYGESASAELTFSTGRMGTPWKGKWITDGSYIFKEKKVSPVPMTFRKTLHINEPLSRAVIYVTAMGIYNLNINGERVGDRYFAPGFTSYKHTLQYQTYDVTALLRGEDELSFTVAGGWAVGSFVFTRKNRISADRQADYLWKNKNRDRKDIEATL